MSFATITYITLDGRLRRAYGYHFVLLNHFRHGEKVSLPYYLVCSMDHTIKEMQKDPQGDHALHQGLMVLFYKLLKWKSIEKPIRGKNTRDDDTESEYSGFNFDSETEGESKDLSKKGRNKGKRKRIVVDSDLSNSEDESFEEKFIKSKKGKGMGKQTQRNKNTSRGANKVKNQILIAFDEDAEEEKKDNMKGKEG